MIKKIRSKKQYHIISFSNSFTITFIIFWCVLGFSTSCSPLEGEQVPPIDNLISTQQSDNPSVPTITPDKGIDIEDEVYPRITKTLISDPILQISDLYPKQIYSADLVYPAHVFLIQTATDYQLLFLDGWGMKIKNTSLRDKNTVLDIDSFRPPCSLILSERNTKEMFLVEYDLISGQNSEIMKEIQKRADGTWKTSPSLSPSGQWIEYAVWSGDFYFNSAEFQNVEIIKIPNGNPIQITSAGGATSTGGVWSPVEDKVAFADLDQNGYQQLYIYIPEGVGKKEKMTNFSDPDIRIRTIIWSEQGDKLALIIDRENQKTNSEDELWLVDFQPVNVNKIGLPEEFTIISSQLYWSDDGKIIVIFTNDSSGNFGINWINIKEMQVQYKFRSDQLGQFKLLENAFPLTRDLFAVGSLSQNLLVDISKDIFFKFREDIFLPDWRIMDGLIIKEDIKLCNQE